MDPFDRYRRRVISARSQHGLADAGTEPCISDVASGEYFTAEQLLELAWKVAGATMAALGVSDEDLAVIGNRVAPIINDLVGACGVKIPDSYRR